MDIFLLSLFHLIRLCLIPGLVLLFGVELLRWLLSDIPRENEAAVEAAVE